MKKNTISRFYACIATVFAVALVCLVIVASCGPYSSVLVRQGAPDVRVKPPVDAFVIVTIDSKVLPEKCDPPTENCEAIIGSLPPIETRKTGSGMMVWHEGRSFILTAAHVCKENDSPTHFAHPEKDVRIKLLSSEEIRVVGVDGISHKAEIKSLNDDLDLCALKVESFNGGAVALAPTAPRVGDVVYSIAAPYGLGGESLSLIFNGRYSGIRRGMHYYTIPTRPGSSGAIVLNHDWQAVGSLHTAFVPLESIGMGAGWQDLKIFLESIN
jgi:S1-C subfamily serine protease